MGGTPSRAPQVSGQRELPESRPGVSSQIQQEPVPHSCHGYQSPRTPARLPGSHQCSQPRGRREERGKLT